MFDKVLIANRGEIVVRIAQTCRELGIRTVGVFSQADEGALHVRRVDEAYCVGPPPPRDSYLNIEAILAVARSSGVDAVHPGYGFLAENPTFAQAVVDAGLIWVGPPADVIRRLGDKVAAKELARSLNVPVIPGYGGEDQTVERLRGEAEQLGFPLLIKAAAGGGGRGMRVVERPEDLPASLEAARREAAAAFGDDRIFLERYLERPRHVEIQVIADAHGNAIHLGERDCSLQRRHQKVIEESPSPALTPDLRAAMGESALRLIRAGGYVNAGTVEFLFHADSFYFLEVNTRIQVEHPVTEMVTGLDLIRLQIEIAAGERLSLSQADIDLRGHAIEARIYAEDPNVGFLPTTGKVSALRPPEGPGIRNDIGIAEGSDPTTYYDPMLAKLIVQAPTRAQAVVRLHDALRCFVLVGPTTNRTFLLWLASQRDFIAGRADTGLIDRCWSSSAADDILPTEVLIAAALILMGSSETASSKDPWKATSGWRANRAERTVRLIWNDRTFTLRTTPEGSNIWRVVSGEHEDLWRIEVWSDSVIVLGRGAESFDLAYQVARDAVTVQRAGRDYRLSYDVADSAGSARARRGDGHASLTSPMPGRVVRVLVREGQRVAAHEPILVLEAMKMEHVIQAPQAGLVDRLFFAAGDQVPLGAPVVELTSE